MVYVVCCTFLQLPHCLLEGACNELYAVDFYIYSYILRGCAQFFEHSPYVLMYL